MKKSTDRVRPAAPRSLQASPARGTFQAAPLNPAVSAPAPASSPEASFARAQRLGHRVGPRHLTPSPPAVQRYFGTADLTKAEGLPFSAKISEDLNLVAIGPQTVYAASNRIDEANRVLSSGSKIVLQAGQKGEFEMEGPPDQNGLSSVSFADYYEVIPRYNPDAEKEDGDVAREVSPDKGDTREETAKKHRLYIEDLEKLIGDFSALQKMVQRGANDPKFAEMAGGLASSDATDWYQALNQWAADNELRRKVLKLGLNEIASTYILGKSLQRRSLDLATLGKSLEVFLLRESRGDDRIALPTDCGAVVGYVVTGGTPVEDDTLTANPGIGSNYYTKLPKNAANVGWNYHWAGVILKDGGDNVTLESAGGTSLGSVGKDSWWMQMYGTRKVDQTFKKQLHLLHVARNRNMISQFDDSVENRTADEQLVKHREKVLDWDRFDSDR